jgi:RimJ/RimL family protein N-acetyltransferase
VEPPTLTDGVIVLNGHTPADVGRHLAGEDEETARRFGWWPHRSTERTVLAAYEEWTCQWRDGGATRAFATRHAGAGLLVGGCEIRIRTDGSGEVSYWTHAWQRGRGYAARSLCLLCDHAASLGIWRLESYVAPDNLASRRVSEAAGFAAGDVFAAEDGQVYVRYLRQEVLENREIG